VCLVLIIAVGCVVTVQLPPEEQAYVDAVRAIPVTNFNNGGSVKIQIPKDKADDVWAIVQVFVSKYSSMKIQTATDNVLEMYNPPGDLWKFGYKLTRLPMTD